MCSVLGNSRIPDVYFRHDGRIDITADVVTALGIRDGDIIDIWDDGEEQLLYVLHKREDVIGRHTAVCRSTKKRHNYMRVWCVKLCRHILNVCNSEDEAHLYIGGVVTHPRIGKAVSLITRNNLFTHKRKEDD